MAMKKTTILSIILAFLFLLIMILVLINHIDGLDSFVYQNIYKIRNRFWDYLFMSITKLGNSIPIFCITIILLLLLDNNSRNILGTTIIATVLSNQALKHIIKRTRPEHIRLIKQGGYSFPSGHAMISIAVYGFLIYYVQMKVKNKRLKLFLTILLSLLIILIGLSRIYVGVHYPSDVIAGYTLSMIILLLVVNFYQEKSGDINEKNISK